VKERTLTRVGSYRCAATLVSHPIVLRSGREGIPNLSEGGKKVAPRCTRKAMAHRVGAVNYSSPLSTSLRTRSDYRGCSEDYTTSLRWRKKPPARLRMILAILLVLGVIAVLLMMVSTLPDESPAASLTAEEVSLPSKTSSGELPKTGGP